MKNVHFLEPVWMGEKNVSESLGNRAKNLIALISHYDNCLI